MKIKLSYKLFISLIIASSISVIVLSFFLYFSANRNFRKYLDLVELNKYSNISKDLAGYYEEDNLLNNLKTNPRIWFEILSKSLKNSAKSQIGYGPHGMMRHRGMHFRNMRQRYFLLNKNKDHILGPEFEDTESITQPIKIDKKIIAWIGTKKTNRITHPLDINFLKNQMHALVMTGGAVFLISLIMSFFLSRHFIAPINKLIDGTKRLANRQFDTLINVNTKDELETLGNAFNVMSKRLQRYEERQVRWISDISHELGTPLSILQGEIEAMQDGIRSLEVKNLDSLYSEVILIKDIVKDLKDISIAETEEFSYDKSPINLIGIIKHTFSLFESRLNKKNVEVVNSYCNEKSVVLVKGDSSRLTQVFSNIIENAIKYGGAGVKIIPSCQITDKKIIVFFEDTGKGVPDSSLPKLFDRFYQVDEFDETAKEGKGLGLSICNSIIKAHNGVIEANISNHGGLQIKISLPRYLDDTENKHG